MFTVRAVYYVACYVKYVARYIFLTGGHNMDEVHIGFLLKGIHDKLRARADADLKDKGLTLTQCRVLGFLETNGGAAAQKEIERHLGVSHPTVRGIIARMEQGGFVESRPDAQDKRGRQIVLTEKAYAVGRQLASFIPENEARLVRTLSDREAQTLRTLLQRVYDDLEAPEKTEKGADA